MKLTKRLEIGEYIIIITHDDENSDLDIQVLDELEGLIEEITITNDIDEDENNTNNNDDNINLN